MNYVVIVSHGTFAPGLQSVLEMLAGSSRDDLLSTSLEDGMSTELYGENFKQLISGIQEEDTIILLGDILGGSPLTTAMEIFASHKLLKNAMIFGGVNLPMALNALLMKDSLAGDGLRKVLIDESKNAIQEFIFQGEEGEEDI